MKKRKQKKSGRARTGIFRHARRPGMPRSLPKAGRGGHATKWGRRRIATGHRQRGALGLAIIGRS
ncbi:hypothetical protein RSSE_p0469 (plasmid) [Ralstonia solanacearum]|nr:hypothetical protein RSSE_p0469 [Ralstonia solanacearum]